MADTRVLSTYDFGLRVGLGQVGGVAPYRKFGANPNVPGTSTAVDLWGAASVRTLPAAAGTVSIVSSLAADDGDPVGTGAHQVKIEGLDSNWLEIDETVTMNGTTPVVTSASFFRINRMYITKSGSGGTNAGLITASIGGSPQAYIQAGDGQTTQVMFTVPANKYFVVDYYQVGVGRMAGTSDCKIVGQINLWNAARGELEGWRTISILYLYNGENHNNVKSVTVIPPKTEVRVQAISSAATQVESIAGGYLVTI